MLADDSVARRLMRLKRQIAKPWVAVVDRGAAYQPMAALLRQGGVPALRTIDRAVRLMGAYCAAAQRFAPANSGPKVS